jgi:hypothetical protein
LFPPTPKVIPNDKLKQLAKHGLFGQLHRPADSKQFDIQMVLPASTAPSSLLCSGEAKNYKSPLEATMLSKCLQKIPQDSTVHFIFCRTVSRTCFAKGFPEFQDKDKNIQNIAVLVVAADPKHPTKCRLEYLNKHCPRKVLLWTTWKTAVIVPVDDLPCCTVVARGKASQGAGGSKN